MPKHARCAVGFRDNDKRYPDLAYVRSDENNLMFRKWPVDPKLVKIWQKQEAKTRGDVFNHSPGDSGTFVSSNHLPMERRTSENLKTDYPSIFMTVSDYPPKKSPRKGKPRMKLQEAGFPKYFLPNLKSVMMTVRELIKKWKPTRTTPFQFLRSLYS